MVIANEIFQDYNIKITTDEHRHLGAVVGSNENKEELLIACTEYHAAFSGFIHGLRRRCTYLLKTIPGISRLLKPLDDAINIFIKVLLLQGYAFNPTGSVLFSLSAKYGGIGSIIPSEICQTEYKNSREITKEIRKEIQFQDNHASTTKIENNIKNQKKKLKDAKLQEVTNKISCKTMLRTIEASTENGAYICLTVIPIKNNDFFLEKQVGCNTNQI